MSKQKLVIDYYSDVLCIWAWIAQRRLQELQEEWGEQVDIKFHFINLFGDTKTRMEKQWGERGGYVGFSQHVIEAASPYENAPVNSEVWKSVRPASSLNAHIVIKAVQVLYGEQEAKSLTFEVQKQFFMNCVDISVLDQVLAFASKESEEKRQEILNCINSGEASASLMLDYQTAKELNIKGSPTWIMNGGRQELFGNVGYRILSANIKEILSKPSHEASWC